MSEGPQIRILPLLPLRDIIVFPHMVVPLFVGRERSINSLEEAMSSGKDVLLAAQKAAKVNDPKPGDIFDVGTVGTIIQLLRLPDGTVKVLIEGKRRARIRRFIETSDFFKVEAELISEQPTRTEALDALMRQVHTTFENYVKLNKRIPPEMQVAVASIEDPVVWLRCFVRAYLRQANERRTHIRALLRELGAMDGEMRQIALNIREGVAGPVVAVIQQGIAQGRFRDVPPKVAVMALIGALNTYIAWQLVVDEENVDESVADIILDTILYGLTKEEKL